MKRVPSVGAVLLVLFAALLAAPSGAAAQVPTQDSVSSTGRASAGEFTVFSLEATSGPSGENPTGHVAFQVFGIVTIDGPVTCLAVSGNTATLNVREQFAPGLFEIVTVQVVDDQPDTFDALPTGRAASDCSPLPPTSLRAPVSGGDITVVDAPPFPTSPDQCKNGRWRNFPGFKNQGDCVSFVATGGKNQPSGH